MKLTIPLYIVLHRPRGGAPLYLVRPLFFAAPARSHEKLERALTLLTNDLRQHLQELGKRPRHDELAAYGFCPHLDCRRLDVPVELRKRTARGWFFFVVFSALGRRVAFTPGLPEVWFELARGEKLAERAAEVLGEHFREREKKDEDDFAPPEQLALTGTAWVTPLDLDVEPEQKIAADEDSAAVLAELFGGPGKLDGGYELHRVGRCLDDLYPDDLDRVILREREVDELTRLLRADDRRPVLLLGAPQVGKTAVLHEYVWRQAAARKRPHQRKRNVWLLAGQRLISGMSYVGQWENRLLAILKEARRRDHVLYFDDFLGLYFAGRTSQSDLSVAHVLKPHVERRELRILAEMTPEAFRVLREHDRGFADLFHLLPVGEPSEEDNLRIVISAARQLEGQHRCRFDIDVLPVVLDLQRRYVRHLSFPGKAALFLRRLAVKYRRAEVMRASALGEFHAQSGLALGLLDGRAKLGRAEVLEALGREVIGQPEALNAAADVIAIAKARLNDPDRPLASLLFLGPTGVGKTQCAKALARYLFAGDDKLLRFDMNEFVSPGSAARLAGTFDNPEGLLTAAVRRQPFAVVLLDEIEKAHPEVFDLLLQVLGEGRLTDALGRTVDFGNTLIVLTSNLGVREAQQVFGFRPGEAHDPSAYAAAAQKFFRPEFFNRLDRIVPFNRLSRADVSRIVRLLIADVLLREGLVRRKCVLRIEAEALERIVDVGFDPVLGARALKRAVERQLTQPVAARLAQGVPETITVIGVYPAGDELAVDVQGLAEVERSPDANPDLSNVPAVLAGVRAALRRIEGQFAHLRPQGEITAASLAGEHQFYFIIQDQLRHLREDLHDLEEARAEAERGEQRLPVLPVRPYTRGKVAALAYLPKRAILPEMAAAEDLRLYLEELAAGASPVAGGQEDRLLDLARQTALLQALAEAGGGALEERVAVFVWATNPAAGRWSTAWQTTTRTSASPRAWARRWGRGPIRCGGAWRCGACRSTCLTRGACCWCAGRRRAVSPVSRTGRTFFVRCTRGWCRCRSTSGRCRRKTTRRRCCGRSRRCGSAGWRDWPAADRRRATRWACARWCASTTRAVPRSTCARAWSSRRKPRRWPASCWRPCPCRPSCATRPACPDRPVSLSAGPGPRPAPRGGRARAPR
jgi:ATP-dependent Clp protease ATP-binding subunit ClpA